MFAEKMLNYVHDMSKDLPELQAAAEADIAVLDRQLAMLNNLLGSLHALGDLEATLPQMKTDEERMNSSSNEQGEQVCLGCCPSLNLL